jgi:hypothetical protein
MSRFISDTVSFTADDGVATADGGAYVIWTADTLWVTADTSYFSADMLQLPKRARPVEQGFKSAWFS